MVRRWSVASQRNFLKRRRHIAIKRGVNMCVDWIRAYCFIIVIIIAAHTTSNTLSGAFSFNRLLGKWGVMLVFSMTKCHRQVQAQMLCHSSAGSLAVSRCTGNREMCSSGNKNSQIQWENLSCTRSSSKVPHALIMPWAAAIWIKSANIWLNGDFFFLLLLLFINAYFHSSI